MSTLRLMTFVAGGLALLAAHPGVSIAQQSSSADDCNQPMRDAITYVTAGQPSRPIVSPDGCWIFVNAAEGPAVLRRRGGVIEPHRVLDVKGQVRGLTHDGKILILATTEVVFIDVEKVVSGAKDVVLGRATDRHLSLRHIMGVMTKDDYLFLQNETDWVSVIDVNKARRGAAGEAIVGGFPTGWAATLALSPDERHLYVASGQGGGGGQIPAEPCTLTGDPLLEREGTILVVDVEQAKNRPESAVIGGIRAGCGGGLATSPDGSRLYLAERLGHSLLVFDTKSIAEGRTSALLATVPVISPPSSTGSVPGQGPSSRAPWTNWPGPTDVAVVDDGRKVVVKSLHDLTVIDAERVQQGAGAILGRIPADPEGGQWRWMVVPSADRRTLVAEIGSGLAVIDVDRLPLDTNRSR